MTPFDPKAVLFEGLGHNAHVEDPQESGRSSRARSLRFGTIKTRDRMYPVSHTLQRAFSLFPERLAVIDGEVRLTYRELTERVQRLAAALRARGLQPGDRVAIVDWNSHRYLETYYACAHAGLALMPLNSRLSSRELISILQGRGRACAAFLRAVREPFRGSHGHSPSRERHRPRIVQQARQRARL